MLLNKTDGVIMVKQGGKPPCFYHYFFTPSPIALQNAITVATRYLSAGRSKAHYIPVPRTLWKMGRLTTLHVSNAAENGEPQLHNKRGCSLTRKRRDV